MATSKRPAKRASARRPVASKPTTRSKRPTTRSKGPTTRSRRRTQADGYDDDFWRRPERFGDLTPQEEAKLQKELRALRQEAQNRADARERENMRQQRARENAKNDLARMEQKAKAQTRANQRAGRIARGLSAREVGKLLGRANRSSGSGSGRSTVGRGSNISGGRGGRDVGTGGLRNMGK